MSHDNASLPVLSMPHPSREQVQTLLAEESRAMVATSKKVSRGRPTDLSWPHLCLGVVVCVLMGWQHQLDLYRLLCFEGFWNWAPVHQRSDQAIYNRLDRAGPWMQRFFEQMSRALRQRLIPWQDRSLAPFAREVLALDESKLDEVGRWLPELRKRCKNNPTVLLGRISALFDVRLQQWIKVDILQGSDTNCKVHARAMIEAVQKGALLLFDRGYFSFEWLDTLTERGLFWITRYSNNATYRIVHVCYDADGVLDAIVLLGTSPSDQARHCVRLVQFWYHGKLYRYLTNVYDPHVLPLADVARLYARRWDIELGFRLVKDHLNFRLLWSAKWPVIEVQLWASLLLAQFFHGAQHEIAVRSGVEPEEVSLDLLVRFTPRWLQRGIDPITASIGMGWDLGIIRKSTRRSLSVPWVDPAWVTPPPPEALRPRERGRHAHRNSRHRGKAKTVACDASKSTVHGQALAPAPAILLE